MRIASIVPVVVLVGVGAAGCSGGGSSASPDEETGVASAPAEKKSGFGLDDASVSAVEKTGRGDVVALWHAPGDAVHRATVFDAKTRRQLRQIDLGPGIMDIAVAGPQGEQLYALDYKNDRIIVVALESGEELARLRVDGKADDDEKRAHLSNARMAVAPGGKTVYVTERGQPAGLWAIDVETRECRRIDLGRRAEFRDAVVSPDGGRVYALAGSRLAIVDVRNDAAPRWIELPIDHQELVLSMDGGKLYATAPVYRKGGAVTVIDARSGEVMRVHDVPAISPYAIALCPGPRGDGWALYVASNQVVALDPTSGEALAHWDLGRKVWEMDHVGGELVFALSSGLMATLPSAGGAPSFPAPAPDAEESPSKTPAGPSAELPTGPTGAPQPQPPPGGFVERQ